MNQPPASLNVYRFGVFEFEPRAGELRKRGVKIKLQGQPLDILTMLLERPGDVLTRDELQKKLWPSDTFVDFDHSLNAAIKRLRDALDDSAETPRYVETVARRGYRFVAPVEAPAQEVPNEQRASRRAQFRWRASIVFGIVAAVLVLALVGAVIAYKFGGREQVIDSVAVLPFANASGDPDAEYLSDGITESLINDLTQLRGLRVIARSTVFRYKGKDTNPTRIGQDLRVRAVLMGRLLQRRGTYVVQTELVDVSRGSQLWGAQFDRKIGDVLVLQEDISREISQKLRLRITGDEEKRIAKSYTANPEAYQDYLRGLYWWNKSTLEGLNKGIEYYQRAIEKDPNYALAYAGLAFCYGSRAGFGGFIAPAETFPQAKDAALRALEIDDTLAEAHTALGFIKTFYEWDWKGAEKELQRAIALNPRYALAHLYYSLNLAYTGRADESVWEAKQALELDPLSLLINRDLGYAWYFARQYDQTIQQEQKTLEIDPNYLLAHFDLGNAYLEKSMYKEGIAEFEKMLAISPDSGCGVSALGYSYAVSGDKAQARKMLERLDGLSKRESGSGGGGCGPARIYAGLGLKDEAFYWLEKGYDDRAIGGGTALKVNPVFDSLRSDPRFADLLRRMNQSP